MTPGRVATGPGHYVSTSADINTLAAQFHQFHPTIDVFRRAHLTVEGTGFWAYSQGTLSAGAVAPDPGQPYLSAYDQLTSDFRSQYQRLCLAGQGIGTPTARLGRTAIASTNPFGTFFAPVGSTGNMVNDCDPISVSAGGINLAQLFSGISLDVRSDRATGEWQMPIGLYPEGASSCSTVWDNCVPTCSGGEPCRSDADCVGPGFPPVGSRCIVRDTTRCPAISCSSRGASCGTGGICMPTADSRGRPTTSLACATVQLCRTNADCVSATPVSSEPTVAATAPSHAHCGSTLTGVGMCRDVVTSISCPDVEHTVGPQAGPVAVFHFPIDIGFDENASGIRLIIAYSPTGADLEVRMQVHDCAGGACFCAGTSCTASDCGGSPVCDNAGEGSTLFTGYGGSTPADDARIQTASLSTQPRARIPRVDVRVLPSPFCDFLWVLPGPFGICGAVLEAFNLGISDTVARTGLSVGHALNSLSRGLSLPPVTGACTSATCPIVAAALYSALCPTSPVVGGGAPSDGGGRDGGPTSSGNLRALSTDPLCVLAQTDFTPGALIIPATGPILGDLMASAGGTVTAGDGVLVPRLPGAPVMLQSSTPAVYRHDSPGPLGGGRGGLGDGVVGAFARTALPLGAPLDRSDTAGLGAVGVDTRCARAACAGTPLPPGCPPAISPTGRFCSFCATCAAGASTGPGGGVCSADAGPRPDAGTSGSPPSEVCRMLCIDPPGIVSLRGATPFGTVPGSNPVLDPSATPPAAFDFTIPPSPAIAPIVDALPALAMGVSRLFRAPIAVNRGLRVTDVFMCPQAGALCRADDGAGAVFQLELVDADNDDAFDTCPTTIPSCRLDNCPGRANRDQADADGDGFGDVCDFAACTATSVNTPFVNCDIDGDGCPNDSPLPELAHCGVTSTPCDSSLPEADERPLLSGLDAACRNPDHTPQPRSFHCVSDTDCPSGQVCAPSGHDTACYQVCASNVDCGLNEGCWAPTHRCYRCPDCDSDCDGVINDCDTDDDNDGVLDDGACDGLTTYTPCVGNHVAACDDNCTEIPNGTAQDVTPENRTPQGDDDRNGIGDLCDGPCQGPPDSRPPICGYIVGGGGSFGGSTGGNGSHVWNVCLQDPAACRSLVMQPPCTGLGCPAPGGPDLGLMLTYASGGHLTSSVPLTSLPYASASMTEVTMVDVQDQSGDGVPDWVFGSPGTSSCTGPNCAVGAIVLVNSATGAAMQTGELAGAGSGFGSAVTRLGNTLYVGAPGLARPDGTITGGVVLVDVHDLSHSLDVWYGEHAGDRFGAALVRVGVAEDTASDGLLIGAPGFDAAAGVDAGAVYAIDASHVSQMRFDGPEASAQIGASASAILPRKQELGGVFLGAPLARDGRGLLAFYALDGTLRDVRVGDAPGDHLGAAISAAADFNRDGAQEVAVSAPGASSGAGRVLIVSADGAVHDMLDGGPGYAFGTFLATPGDVTGDGFSDLLVGAPGGQLRGGPTGIFVVLEGYGGTPNLQGERITTVAP